jgi:hypothetical protein
MAQKRTAKNLPRSASSIATVRPKLRDNNEKLQGPSITGSADNPGYLNRQTAMPNTPLKLHTCTTTPEGGALHYDDVMETGTKYLVPQDFQTTVDRSDRLNSWQPMQPSRDAPDAVTRTETGMVGHDRYHMGPSMHQWSVADNEAISKGHVTSVSQLQGRQDPQPSMGSTWSSSDNKSSPKAGAPTEKLGRRANPRA